MSKKSWAPAIFVAIVGVVVVGVVVVGAGIYLFFQHVGIESTTPESAVVQFEQAQKPFQGQTPLVEIDHGRVTIHRPDATGDRRAPRLVSLNVLTFDPNHDRLVRVSVPFWLVRLKSTGTVRFSSDGMFADRVQLTVEDLERHGPGVVVNHEEPGGQRVLVWTQ